MWRNRLDTTDPKIVLAHECGRPGASVQLSWICHEKAETAVFAGRNFGERDVVRFYYGSLAYGDLEKELKVTERYGEDYMEITVESLWRWALELSEVVTNSNGQRSSMWMILAPY